MKTHYIFKGNNDGVGSYDTDDDGLTACGVDRTFLHITTTKKNVKCKRCLSVIQKIERKSKTKLS